MHILYLTHTFPPEPGPSIRPLEQAQHLKKKGYEVTIITAFPSYPNGIFSVEDRKTIYRWDKVGSIPVLRVATMGRKNLGFLFRSLSFASFSFSSIVAGLFVKDVDIVIASIPNHLTEFAGLVLGKIKKAKVILEIRDLPEDSFRAAGLNQTIIYRLLLRYFKWIYSKVDLVASPYSFSDKILKEVHGVHKNKLIILPHGLEFSRIRGYSGDEIREEYNLQDKFIVLYAGSFSWYYDVENIVETAKLLQKKTKIFFILIGHGHRFLSIQSLINENNISNILLLNSIEPNKIGKLLNCANLFLASLVHHRIGEFIHTKITEYMATGRPTISIENVPRLKQFLERIDAGSAVGTKNPKALAIKITDYYEDGNLRNRQGENARVWAEKNFSRNKTMKQLLEKIKNWE